MQNETFSILDKLSQLLAAGVMSTFGGVAAYVYQSVKNDKKFSFGSFLISAFLSFFAGNLVGSFIPLSYEYRDGLLMIAGFSSFPLLSLIEVKGKTWITMIVERNLGISTAAVNKQVDEDNKDLK